MLEAEYKKQFDEQLEQVLHRLPQHVHHLMGEVPLCVEDFPSRRVMRRLGVRDRSEICGYYSGIPLTKRSVEQSGELSDVVHIYREGILAMCIDEVGQIDKRELREQIRITILHELGHHHGLDEEELEELGYG